MPSFWSRNAIGDGASKLFDRRSRSADSRRAAKLHRRLAAHKQDSSVTDLSAEQTEKDAHCCRTVDTTTSVGEEAADFQSLDDNVDGAKTGIACPDVKVLQYKVENERLKEFLRSRTHDLREKCSALSICQTELAEALISQTADDNCVKGRQIHKLARNLKDRLSHSHSEMQMKLLREERDQAALDLTALSGKMTTCKTIAEEQAKLLKGQLDTIRKFEKKIQGLEKATKEMRAGHRQKVHDLERSMQDMEVAHNEKLQDYENSVEHLQAKHKEEIQHLEQSIHDMRAGYKQERAALEEQLGLHEQRAVLQDRKIKKCHHELDMARSEILKGRTREAELEDHLHAQANICQDTTTELSAASKEIERLKHVSLELHEQEERMEQLWVDNARLVQLLADTDEYQNLVHDMQGGKGLVFCPTTSRFQSLAERYGASSSYGPMNPKRERDQWIPAELYDLVMAFRKQHCFGSEIEVVQDLLRLVTNFWRERHRKIVYQVKVKHEKQLADLRRQLSQRLPYGEVVQSSHPRSTTNGAQLTKALKNTSFATRCEVYSAPRQLYGPSRDMEYIGSPPTRRAEDDTHNTNEVPTKYRESSPQRGGRANRSARISPNSYIDGLATGGENPGDEHESYSKSVAARKNRDPEGKMDAITGESRGSYAVHREVGSRQRYASKHLPREAVSERLQKSKTGGLVRRFGAEQWQGDHEEQEKLKSPDQTASRQKKDWFLRRNVPSSTPDGSVDGDKPAPTRRRRKMPAANKHDREEFRSLSGSSSV
ncbi:unnamed protein product [Calypogeia fissa]